MKSRGEHAIPTSQFRLLKASTLVLAILLVIPGVETVVDTVGSSAARSTDATGIDSTVLVGGADALASLERVEKAAIAEEATVSDAFREEVGFLPNAQEVRASSDGSVVGYAVSGESASVSASIVEHMESRGWTSVPLGEVDGATFVKADGACTWALVTCTQIGDSTSVVVRCKEA